MDKKVTILGAGLAGLLAGNILTRAGWTCTVLEAQPSLPSNHSALLRFRSSAVPDATGIAFSKVRMIKCVETIGNPVADALAYSFKNTQVYRSDRSINAGLVIEDRWIAPDKIETQLAAQIAALRFDQKVTNNLYWDGNEPVISTLPMPILMDILRYGANRQSFPYRKGHVVRAHIDRCDAYVSVLIPDPSTPIYRISITGDVLIIEASAEIKVDAAIDRAAATLGLNPVTILPDPVATEMKYGKLLPIDETARQDFIYWASDKHNVWSIGRFATWRPNVLLDDLVKDIRLIERWIGRAGRYEAAKARDQ